MRSRALLTGAAVAAAVAFGATAANTGAAAVTKVPRDCRHETFKPKGILIACGDGSLFMTGMHWSSWGRKAANGVGTAHLNDCNPFCAAGHFHKYKARIKLSSAHFCRAEKVTQFRRLRLTWVNGTPPNTPSKISDPVACPSAMTP
ncbi:MAG TPA: hypothetical protein VGF74_12465 [Thermoleophilaceae bacterium]